MALADPQTITVSTVAQPMPRVGLTANSGSFQHADSTYFLDVFHNIGKGKNARNQHGVRFTGRKTSADPYIPANSILSQMSCTFTANVPQIGYAVADQKAQVVGFLTWLQANSGAIITQLLGNES